MICAALQSVDPNPEGTFILDAFRCRIPQYYQYELQLCLEREYRIDPYQE